MSGLPDAVLWQQLTQDVTTNWQPGGWNIPQRRYSKSRSHSLLS